MLPLPKLSEETLPTLEMFIRAKVRDSGAEGVVMGLSGGIDSAAAAALCTRALGKEHVHLILMPEETSPERDLKHAREFAEQLGAVFKESDVSDLVKSASDTFGPLARETGLARSNLKARARMTGIYYYANCNNLLVVGTSNKTEMLLGYFTKHGDGASDIAPLADLYKAQVRELAALLGVPASIIHKPPTAGLVEGQTDEEDLGHSYDTLDRVLFALMDNKNVETIASETRLKATQVSAIKARVLANRHKRKATKVPKVGSSSLGSDLRE